jgi:hypothetical protein
MMIGFMAFDPLFKQTQVRVLKSKCGGAGFDLLRHGSDENCPYRENDIVFTAMKILRRVFIVLTALGAVMAYFQPGSEFDVLPFPAAGLSVRLRATVKDAGEYHLVVAMPVTNDDVALGDDTQSCSLTVRIAKDYNGPIVTNSEVTSISLEDEFGFAKTQDYRGGSWYLKPGVYDVDILSRKTCQAAVSRGATISLEEQIFHPTERFLWDSLRHECGVVFFWVGIVGLSVCEFKKPRGQPDGEK